MKLTLTSFFLVFFSSFLTVQLGPKEILIDSISVRFDFNKADITQLVDFQRKLALPRDNVSRILIVAYTDSVGSVAYNCNLASRRMESVSEILQHSSYSTIKTDTVNASETNGFRLNNDGLNRRVDVLFVGNTTKQELVYDENQSFEFQLDTPIDLHINFVYGTAEFVQNTYPNLEKLVQLLKNDTTLFVALGGHVCCGPDMALSRSRAQAVMVYLVKNGIDRNRITATGYSNTKPLVKETNNVSKAINRRVEAAFTRKL